MGKYFACCLLQTFRCGKCTCNFFVFLFFLSGNFQWVRATHASSGHSGDSCVSLRICGPIKTCSSLLCPVIARTPLFFCETIEVISLQCIIDRRPSKINKQKSFNLFAIPWGGFTRWTRFGDDGRSSQTHRPTTRSEQRSSGERRAEGLFIRELFVKVQLQMNDCFLIWLGGYF